VSSCQVLYNRVQSLRKSASLPEWHSAKILAEGLSYKIRGSTFLTGTLDPARVLGMMAETETLITPNQDGSIDVVRRTTMKRSSSWISSILYRNGFLAIFLKVDRDETPVALLYGDIPPRIPGLLIAGTGSRSIGLAYNRLVKDRYPYNRVEGRAKVEELKRLMVVEMRKIA
jgi:hypothetical protein